jgi:hypothetical protein
VPTQGGAPLRYKRVCPQIFEGESDDSYKHPLAYSVSQSVIAVKSLIG